MQWIYLSPHFDDVALSCGGLAWEQVQRGATVSIWTVCGGVPDPLTQAYSPFAHALHERWGAGPEAVPARQVEDIASCQVLGASYRHLPMYDCIYRVDASGQAFYASEASLTGPLHPHETSEAARLSQQWRKEIPRNARLVCPLGLGNHVDHQLTRLAAELLGRPLWFYADYPYVLRNPEELTAMTQAGWQARRFRLRRAALRAWQDAVAAHASQISTFWQDEAAMRQAIAEYAALEGGVRLWRRV
jgi:LmbE family N-acetylglucosaminyl deacetylase